MSVKYTYSISNDTLNSEVDSGSLTEEIQISAITTSLDYINKEADDCDIWFKAALSGADQTTLSGVVATHEGEPLVTPGSVRIVDQDVAAIAEIDDQGRLKVAIDYEIHDHPFITTLSGLSDTPDYYDVDKYLRSTASGTEWATVSGAGAPEEHTHTESDITDLDKYTQAEVDVLIASVSGTTASGVVGPLPCLQIRRTTDYSLTTSWVDITFNVTDIENNVNIIEHDNTNTDRILIKDNGYYKISYTLSFEPSNTTVTTEAHLRKNDATVIPGSWMHVRDSNDIQEMSNDFIAYLNSDDFITLQIKTDVSGDIRADLIMSIVKLQGSQGDKGDPGQGGQDGLPGTGSTINILENDILTASGIGNLNFEGDVSVVDSGGGIATVTVSGGGGVGVAGDMTVVQARRTTSFNITTSYTDVPFDATDVETDSTVLEHNNTNTERIDIKADGIYTVVYNLPTVITSTPSAQINVFTKVLKNGSTLMDGSELDVGYHYSATYTHSEHSPNNRNVTVQLSSGDYLTLQTKYTESDGPITSLDTNGNVIFKVIKLTGAKGADGLDGLDGSPGPSGSGSNINVYDDGVVVDGSPFEALNFSGATISGSTTVSGGVDIEIPVFGSEFSENSSDSESTTTSTSYQQKARLTTDSLSSGKHRVGWYYEWQHRNTANDFKAQIQINDSTTIMEHQEEPQDLGADQWRVAGGFYYYNGSGILNIDLDYCSSGGNTAAIRKARLEIWRVS